MAMKSVISFLICVGILGPSGHLSAQDAGSRKPLNNPMYSTHNYKHPNLAAAARRWEVKEGVAVKKPNPDEAQLTNYKRQMPIAQPVGGITVEPTTITSLIDRNYKIQRLRAPTPLGPPSEYYIKKEHRKAANTTIGE